MSYCRKEGKDVIIFATEEDHKEPSKISLPEPEPQPGLILPDGSINWNCPCLGGMATGPCGVEFRDAFSCFHYSKEDPKGSDCFESFRQMQSCMSKYPALYNQPDEDDNFSADFSGGDNKDMLETSAKSSSFDKEIEDGSRSAMRRDDSTPSSNSFSSSNSSDVKN